MLHLDAANIVGAIALGISLISYSIADDIALKRVKFAALFVWLLHFILLDAWSSTLTMILAVFIVGGTIFNKPRIADTFVVINFLTFPFLLSLMIFGYAGPKDLPPVIGSIIINAGFAYATGGRLTLCIAAAETLFILNGYLIGSPYMMATSTAALIALGVREWKRSTTLQPAN